MFGLGPSELVIILVLVLFFYGGKRLPQIGHGLGRGIREFKRAIKGTEGVPEVPRNSAVDGTGPQPADPKQASGGAGPK